MSKKVLLKEFLLVSLLSKAMHADPPLISVLEVTLLSSGVEDHKDSL